MKKALLLFLIFIILSSSFALAASGKKGKQKERAVVVSAGSGATASASRENFVLGNYWALIIGVDDYEYWPKLDTAVRDAKAVSDVLEKKYGFSKDHVIELYDKDATRRNILRKFGELAKTVGKDDSLFIYYAGHGHLDGAINAGYWVPVDSEINFVDNYIPNSTIRDYIAGIETKHTFLVSDSCFSGTLFGAQRSKPPVDKGDRYFEEAYSRRSRLGLASGGAEPVSDGGYDNHSIFNYYFLQALNEINEKYVTSGTLFERLKVAVANNSNQTPVYKPLKDAKDEGGEFVFRVASLGAFTPGPSPVGGEGSEVESAPSAEDEAMSAEEARIDAELKKVAADKAAAEAKQAEDAKRAEKQRKLEEKKAKLVAEKKKVEVAKLAVSDGAEMKKQTDALLIPKRNEVLTTEQKDAERHMMLGKRMVERNLFDKAAEEYSKAVELDSNLVEARVRYGAMLLKLRDPAKALENLNKAIELDPKCLSAYEWKSLALRTLGRDDEAEASFNMYLGLGGKVNR